MLTFSTDLVFDGRKRQPRVESDDPGPLNADGPANGTPRRSSRRSRTCWWCARRPRRPLEHREFCLAAAAAAARGLALGAVVDRVVSPTYVPDLVDAGLDLLIDAESGLWHVTNSRPTS